MLRTYREMTFKKPHYLLFIFLLTWVNFVSATIDLSLPQSVWLLSHYSADAPAFDKPEIGGNLSGVTYNHDTNTYFMVRNNALEIYEYSADFATLHRVINISGTNNNDFEGITYLGNFEFMIVHEANRGLIISIPDNNATNVGANPNSADVQQFTLPPRSVSNNGLEGVCYDPQGNSGSGTFYAVQEKSPMKLFKFDRPDHSNNVRYDDGSLAVVELFDAEVVLSSIATDLAGCTFNLQTGRLLLISQEGRKIIDIDLLGNLIDEMPLDGANSGGAPQYEGITFGENSRIIVVSEPYWIRIYNNDGLISDETAPVISDIQVTNITDTKATVSWVTDELADSEVSYGEDTGYGSLVSDTSFVINHSFNLTGLSADTEYHYMIVSRDNSGNIANTTNATFTTLVTIDPEPVTNTRIDVGDTWKYFKGTTYPGVSWSERSYIDSTWLQGPTGIGYGDGDDATVLTDMEDSYLTVYARKGFHVEDTTDVGAVWLSMIYDDGFIAYINGQEVRRVNMPSGTVDHNTEAAASINPMTVEQYNLSSFSDYLVNGTNILAIEMHNGTLSSSDLSIIPELAIELLSEDITAPTRSAGAPSGILSIGTRSVTLELITDEIASCRYTSTPDVNYDSMSSGFFNADGLVHSSDIDGLVDGGIYVYYVKCQDQATNTNEGDYVIGFSIDELIVGAPQISLIADTRILQGNTYSFIPPLTAGEAVRWTKEYGQDDMSVHPDTGEVIWFIPENMPSESFHIGVKATNSLGSYIETWVLTIGDGNIIYMGPNEVNTNLADGMDAMSSGDTLIIRDGVYTSIDRENITGGTSNTGQQPPAGSASAFTTIIAENPGKVTFDGEGRLSPLRIIGNYDPPDFAASTFDVSKDYMAFKGMIIKNGQSGIRLDYVHHFKLIDIGVVDSARNSGGNAANIYIHRSEHVLLEGIYSWGHSRYKIQFKDTMNSVVRRSIARIDEYRGSQPIGGFISYCSKNILFQNNIIVDGDSSKFWINFANHANLYGVPATGCRGYPEGNIFVRNIGLNSDTGLMLTDANETADPTIWQDMVGWDLKMDRYNAGTGIHTGILRGVGASISDQITMGRITADPGYDSAGGRGFFYSRSEDSFVKNSIMYQFGWDGSQTVNQGPLTWASANAFGFNYNNIYDFDGAILGGNAGSVSNTIGSNPLENGLQYLPRIEAGSSLQSAGLSGGRVGANITTFIGKSGTFYGDVGYDQETGISMWPFPHEDTFKEQLQSYTYTGLTRSGATETLSGNRGFANSSAKQLNGVTDVTLTSYIWEYLGNEMPIEIYGEPANSVIFSNGFE